MGAKKRVVLKSSGGAGKGVSHQTFLAEQLKDPEFRHHFEQRKLVHEVAIAVRGMRELAGLTQAQLATRVGTSQPTIARIEKGTDQRTPQWGTLQRIAAATGRQLRLVFGPAQTAPLVVLRPGARTTSAREPLAGPVAPAAGRGARSPRGRRVIAPRERTQALR